MTRDEFNSLYRRERVHARDTLPTPRTASVDLALCLAGHGELARTSGSGIAFWQNLAAERRRDGAVDDALSLLAMAQSVRLRGRRAEA